MNLFIMEININKIDPKAKNKVNISKKENIQIKANSKKKFLLDSKRNIRHQQRLAEGTVRSSIAHYFAAARIRFGFESCN